MPDETPTGEDQRGDAVRGDGASGEGASGVAADDARLARLERGLEELSARLRALEQYLSAPRAREAAGGPRPFGQGGGPQQNAAGAADVHAPQEELPFGPRASGTAYGQAGAAAGASRDEEGARDGRARVQPAAARRARVDFETLVGGSLAKWLGIVAGVLGVGFFLKYAFDSQWVGARGRVAVGALVGLGLVALGGRLRARGYRSYANVLAGGGVLILYLSVYAARVFYDLVGAGPAFALMAAVTCAAVWLSVRHDALPVAVLALVGGFATPVLLSTGVDNQIGLFAYVAALDAGVLALAYFKRWRVLNHLAFWLTVLTFAVWLASFYEPWKLWPTLLFLTLFFLAFSALAVLHNVLARRPARWHDLSLIVANATLYFATAYALMTGGGFGPALGTFALLVSAFHALLFHVARTRHAADRLLPLAYVGAAVTFFTVAVAVQLDQHWVTIGWAVEALMLTWIGLRAGERAARYAALAVFALAGLHWLSADVMAFTFELPGTFVPLANRRAVSCAALAASLGGAAWLYRRGGRAAAVAPAERDSLSALLVLAAGGVVLALLSADVNDYYRLAMRRDAAAGGSNDGATTGPSDNARQFALSALWILYGAALWWAGHARRLQFLRLAGLALLALAASKLLLADAFYFDAAWHRPLFNQTFAAFALFVAACWYAARLYARADGRTPVAERRVALPSLAVAGNLFAVVALSLEAVGYFDKQLAAASADPAGAPGELRLAAQLSLSLVWAVYGGAMLFYGHARGNRPLRLLALALLGAATAKVFLLDLAALERFYRIVSFVALGAILLGVSFLYQQQQQQRAARAEGD